MTIATTQWLPIAVTAAVTVYVIAIIAAIAVIVSLRRELLKLWNEQNQNHKNH
jgi:hypothetical protein